MTRTPLIRLALALSLGLQLAACGGGNDDAAATATFQPLLDDDGNAAPSAPAAVPADAAARTHAGHYATEAQARDLAAALGGRALVLQVNGDSIDTALRWKAGQPSGGAAAVLVRGHDLRQAAAVANRLQVAGFSHVFLVTS